ncbi:classical AGP protein [Rhynchospora pubera]|uniref:Classical AGP protein n=1 Tax=Rhynchospora pubera TaxID=906938 RepID=A0AAV8AJT5_9POAL|nr:classical AGP protein [Rhynchospora pubera]KAJ4785761.1 classical AGP protein [Rhynchospora pubera]
MALNPQLYGNGMPVAFIGEMFVLARDGVEFQIDKIPGPGTVKTKGTIYLSNIRMVFVSRKPVDGFVAFDMPMLYVHGEKFNQPIFACNNISGFVDPILFKEGGCGTFVPLFLNLIASVRQYNQHSINAAAVPRVDPLQAAQTPVEDMMRHAYVDPNDPTKIFLQQPTQDSQLRRRNYHQPAPDNSEQV